eukprot:746728-Hanusia_phi.AAC.1
MCHTNSCSERSSFESDCRILALHIDPFFFSQYGVFHLQCDAKSNFRTPPRPKASLQDDCPVLLQLASHHKLLDKEIARCGSFAIRRSSLVVGDLLGQGSSGE